MVTVLWNKEEDNEGHREKESYPHWYNGHVIKTSFGIYIAVKWNQIKTRRLKKSRSFKYPNNQHIYTKYCVCIKDLFSYSKLIQNWVMTKRSKTVWSNSLEGCVLCLAEFTWTASMWQRSAHTFPGMRSNLRKIQKHDTVSPDSGGTIRAGCCEQTIHTGTEWET